MRYIEPQRPRLTIAFRRLLDRDLAIPRSFASITTLTIVEAMWTFYAPLPPTPRLASLHIVLSGCMDMYWWGTSENDVYNLFSSGPDAALECSALQLLEISSSHPDKCCMSASAGACFCRGCRLSFVDVAWFIRTCLKLASLRLPVLRLHGIESVDMDPEGAWDALAAVVSLVEVFPEAATGMLVNASLSTTRLTRGFDANASEFETSRECLLSRCHNGVSGIAGVSAQYLFR